MVKAETVLIGIGGFAAYYILKGINGKNLPSIPSFDLKNPFWQKKLEDYVPNIKTELEEATTLKNQVDNQILMEQEKQAQITLELAKLESEFNQNDSDIIRLNKEILELENRKQTIVAENNAKFDPVIKSKQDDYRRAQSALDNEINVYNEEVYLRDNPKIELGVNAYNPIALAYYISEKNKILDRVQSRINSLTVNRDNVKIYLDRIIEQKNSELNQQLQAVNQELTAKREILTVRIVAQDEIQKMIEALRSEIK